MWHLALALVLGSRFAVLEASIRQIQKALTDGAVTSEELVEMYLARVHAYDPTLNAMIFLNPSAREEAAALDRERRERGPRGPLHGVPIVLKDNFDAVGMPTTGGSIALAGFIPEDDAFQVRKLKEAGVVILGKTNMHELARGITTVSSLGGQTRNPYGLTRNVGGSSGGTGAAIAASFAAVGMGTDTCGSIRIPAAQNNLVGLRPTQGLSSRDGILPLSHTQDMAGPIARTVTDVAIVLDATVGFDAADPTTSVSRGKIPRSYADSLKEDSLKGARVGALDVLFGKAPEDAEVSRVVRATLDAMKKEGAEIVEVEIPDFDKLMEGIGAVLRSEFKFDLKSYLDRAPHAPVHSLQEILDGGLYHEALATAYETSNAVTSLDTKEYLDAIAKRAMVRDAVLKLLDEKKLDALAYPTIRRKAAHLDEPQQGSNCQLSVTSGLPAISIPAGFTPDGMPVGVDLLGRAFSEPRLLEISYAYEAKTHPRRPPSSTPSLESPAVWSFDVDVGRVRARFTVDQPAMKLTYFVRADEEAKFAHVHRAPDGKKGPVVFPLSLRPFREARGEWALNEATFRDLVEGNLYLRAVLPETELRAQMKPRPALAPGAPH